MIKEDNKLIIELTEDQDEVMNYLIETRGIAIIDSEFDHWLRIRTDTIREELKIEIINDLIKGETIKELRERIKIIKEKANDEQPTYSSRIEPTGDSGDNGESSPTTQSVTDGP